MGFPVDPDPDPDAGVSLSYQEFLDAVAWLRAAGFPVERDPAEAWPDFVGWRAHYEQAAYALAFAIDAVPVQWSGPRRHPYAAIPRSGQQAPGSPPTSIQSRAANAARRRFESPAYQTSESYAQGRSRLRSAPVCCARCPRVWPTPARSRR
jgi:hypothetical protein